MAIVIPIGVDTSGLSRGLSQGTSGLRKFGKMAAIVGGAAALGGLVATLKIGVDEFMAAQKVMAQTGAVLKSTGGVANVTSKQITTMSESLMKLSGIDDEAIQSGQNLLLTFTKIRNETGAGNKIFDEATLAMTNLSVAMGKDMSSSAILVGKALNDPIKGVGALSKAGVQFTASQKDTIKSLVESGDVMGAQKMILKELETQFGGSAKAAGQTLPGQLNILKETFRNTAADLVATFIPTLSRAATALLNFVRGFANAPTLTAKIDFVIGKFRDLAWSGIQTVSDWWQKTKVTFEDNPGNRLKVTITDSGEEQLNTFFEGIKKSLDKKADTLGKSLGKKIVKGIFGGGKEQATESGDAFINDLLVSLLINKPAFDLGKRFVLAIFEGMREEFNRSLTDNPVSVFIKSLGIVLTPQFGAVGKAAADKLAEAVGTGRKKVVRAITDTVREAVNAARQGLAGLGSSLGGMLSTITGTSSADAKEAARLRKQQKDQQEARERARLTLVRDSAATDEELAQAKQDLADFELEINATAAEDRVAIAQSANQRSIDALIESFNQGTISAKKFESDLNGIIGADRGGELGAAFAGAFKRELESIVAAANDIQSIINKSGKDKLPITGGMGTPAGDAARAAHAEWKSARAARLKTARDARRTKESSSGTKIDADEQVEIDRIMAAYDKKNPEPIRMAAGGILKRQVFTAGEAGREAVIPLGSSEAMGIMRDALGGGGGGTTYNLVINAGLGTNPDELGRTIVESIKKFEKRNGQVFAGPQIQATSAGVSTNGGTQTRNLRKN
jgi:hypothetical protein